MTTIENRKVDIKWTIKLCRIKTELTQEEMAKKLGVSKEAYQKYETGANMMRVDTAIRFSEITGIPFDSIIFFEN